MSPDSTMKLRFAYIYLRVGEFKIHCRITTMLSYHKMLSYQKNVVLSKWIACQNLNCHSCSQKQEDDCGLSYLFQKFKFKFCNKTG